MCVRVAYTLIVVDVDVVQPAQVLVSLQEAGQLVVLCSWLGQQLTPLPLLHVPTKQEVSKVLEDRIGQQKAQSGPFMIVFPVSVCPFKHCLMISGILRR